MEKLNPEQQWPAMFEGLDEQQRHAVRQALASSWHEGWSPTGEGVQNLTDLSRGTLSMDTFLLIQRQVARQAVAQQPAPAQTTKGWRVSGGSMTNRKQAKAAGLKAARRTSSWRTGSGRSAADKKKG